VASTRGLNASDQHPSQGRSGSSDNAKWHLMAQFDSRSIWAPHCPSLSSMRSKPRSR
jgi:hypothetical protein